MARWTAELASIGWTPDRLASSVDAASQSRIAGAPSLTEVHRVLGVVLADDGALARMKVFSRRHLLVELAPHFYGWEPRLVEAVAARVLADPEVIPVVGVAGAIEPVHALASVIAREAVIAERIAAGLDRTDASVAAADRMAAAVADTEAAIGGVLAGEQRRAVEAICSSGRGVELVVGVAGAGRRRCSPPSPPRSKPPDARRWEPRPPVRRPEPSPTARHSGPPRPWRPWSAGSTEANSAWTSGAG